MKYYYKTRIDKMKQTFGISNSSVKKNALEHVIKIRSNSKFDDSIHTITKD